MSDGEIVYDDDPSVETGDPVWRRIPPGWWTFDHNEGRVRPTSKNFQYSKDKKTGKRHPMSVTLGKDLAPDAALAGQPAGFKLIGWTADHLRNLELGVCRDERPDIVAHGLVFTLQLDGTGKRRANISDSVRDRLAASGQCVIELTPSEIEKTRLRTAAP
ncbi:MAG: hypothetical protein Q7R41_01075 [Phycisphaerales bacterium]|nr:hypothetical protein [Phycisphaerales bacterium]